MKYRGKLRMTKELLENYLGLEELEKKVQISNVEYDSDREIVSIYLSSEEAVPEVTFETGEGHGVLDVDPHILIDYMNKSKRERSNT